MTARTALLVVALLALGFFVYRLVDLLYERIGDAL